MIASFFIFLGLNVFHFLDLQFYVYFCVGSSVLFLHFVLFHIFILIFISRSFRNGTQPVSTEDKGLGKDRKGKKKKEKKEKEKERKERKKKEKEKYKHDIYISLFSQNYIHLFEREKENENEKEKERKRNKKNVENNRNNSARIG